MGKNTAPTSCGSPVLLQNFRSRHEALRTRGHSYGRALCGVADRLLGAACVLLQRQVLFDPDHGRPAAAQHEPELRNSL